MVMERSADLFIYPQDGRGRAPAEIGLKFLQLKVWGGGGHWGFVTSGVSPGESELVNG